MHDNIFQIILIFVSIPTLLLVWQRLRIKKLSQYNSPQLGNIRVLQKFNGDKVLSINYYPQSVSTGKENIVNTYWQAVTTEILKFCQDRKNAKILILGLGGCTIPNLVAQRNPEITQTIVEIDRFMIRTAREQFGLDDLPHYQIIQADAFKLFDQLFTNRGLSHDYFPNNFDIIVVDIFVGEPPFVPLESNKPHFVNQLLLKLKKDGLIIFNRPNVSKDDYQWNKELKDYLKTVFTETRFFEVNDPRGFRNDILTGRILKS